MTGGQPAVLLFAVFVVPVALVTQGVSAASQPPGVSQSVRLAIPIDADAPGIWSQAIAGAPSVGIIILNPSSGPGESVKGTYEQLVGEAQAKGIHVLGYVDTQWANGKVSVQQAEASIDRYYAWYHVDGIMLDEANYSCDPAPLGFYTALYSYVKAKPAPGIVMLNPGEATGECYAAISDVLITFENDYASYLGDYVGGNWTAKYPASHFFHIVFDVPTAAGMQSVASLAGARGAGWLYVTNLNNSKGNPYSSLPSYYNQELAYLGQPGDPAPFLTRAPMIFILGLAAAGSVLVVVRRRKKVAY
jgi:hypothetical protein